MMNGETRHFKIGKWGAFRSKWERLLPDIIHRDMYDGLMTLVNGHISIDPVRLGEFNALYRQHGQLKARKLK